MMSLGTDLRACILHGVNPPVLLGGPRLRRTLLRHPHGRSLRGPGLFPRLFFGCPGLELLEQFFSKWLADLGLALTGLALTGLALTDLDSALIGRFNRRSNFIARRRIRCGRRQILSAGDCLNC